VNRDKRQESHLWAFQELRRLYETRATYADMVKQGRDGAELYDIVSGIHDALKNELAAWTDLCDDVYRHAKRQAKEKY
jgi:hypothetical protein